MVRIRGTDKRYGARAADCKRDYYAELVFAFGS